MKNLNIILSLLLLFALGISVGFSIRTAYYHNKEDDLIKRFKSTNEMFSKALAECRVENMRKQLTWPVYNKGK